MWFPIQGYEGLYEVHVSGGVRNSRSKRLLSPISGKYALSKDGIPSRVSPATVRESIPVEALAAPVELPEWLIGEEDETSKYSPLFPWKNPNVSIAGYAGEYLVCYELCMRGVICAMNTIPNAPYDIIGDFGKGELFKIQVKTNIKPKVKENKYPAEVGYSFADIGKVREQCDVFAFVALDRQLVLFEIADNSTTNGRVFSVNSFVAKQKGSIDNVLTTIYGKKRVRG